MTEPLNFQSIIMTLQSYWAEYGCLIWQPYYSQVGAGTMNPATFLRVLGPEPWNVAYVEPSIRPDDGRYGENPNRMQMHYQFQVILKPDPGNPQQLYLDSLRALGIDPHQHDIRFVEDNWEQPAIGAWGLGWEVWLDGQEITQFTYLQQAGGIVLEPISVELTYGLERIAIALQRIGSFREIQWSPLLKDGDVNLQAEQEHSKYYFEIADVERLRQMYELYYAEIDSCLEQGLVLPAYDYLLKCSHTFNVLDTRGAIGVTERQALFGRMRELARRVSEAYLEQRQRLEYPFLEDEANDLITSSSEKAMGKRLAIEPQQITIPAPFLLEIGTEELPAKDLDTAIEQLKHLTTEMLKKLRLDHGAIRVVGTPRRLVVHVEDLSPRQIDLEQVVKGPPAERAFGPDGEPTKAAQGFARSKGVSVNELQVRELDGGSYVVAVVHEKGQDTITMLAEELSHLVASLRFDKSMRWNSTNTTFSRPIRWLLALYGSDDAVQIVPFEYAGLNSSNITYGLRFYEPEQMKIASIQAYFETLSEQGILLDCKDRQEVILNQVEELAAEVGGKTPDDPALLSEVANLVEAPTALIGTFDSEYLKLPREVLISVMKKHQRYFPVVPLGSDDDSGQLLPNFIAVRNGGHEWMDVVRDGNEHVIRARFADADFFVREDLKKPLEAYIPKLGALTFQVKLGSMLDKTERINSLVDDLVQLVGLDEKEIITARRAAKLCKADLTTKMVVEMTSLQGQMGRFYAIHSGETKEVAQAICEHYLPRYSGDDSPSSRAGLVVGLADRLDTLMGLFAAGLAPSGNKDPFAQRRAALGLVQNLIYWDLDIDLRPALDAASKNLPIPANEENRAAVMKFIIERLRNILLDGGAQYDVVDAVLAAQGYNPARASNAVAALENWITRSDWSSILPAYSRCVRITCDLKERYPVNPDNFVQEEEFVLFTAIKTAEIYPRSIGSVEDFLNAFLPMVPVINNFFDEVLVMADNEHIRQNRLGLIQRIAVLAESAADMSRLEGF